MMVDGYPAWQVLILDLRCHGDCDSHAHQPPHTLAACADDVLALLHSLKIFPHALIGHSFGGKVVMEMIRRFGKRLPRPIQVWVLDSLPGPIRCRDPGDVDHPERLIEALCSVDLGSISSRSSLVTILEGQGFSKPVAQWAATNLRQTVHGSSLHSFHWEFEGAISILCLGRSLPDAGRSACWAQAGICEGRKEHFQMGG